MGITPAGTSRRPGSPSLTIDTSGNTALPPSGATAPGPGADSTSRSPAGRSTATSPTSPSGFQPLSPRKRHRGYSLRRAVFHRNLEDNSPGANSPSSTIELSDVGHPSSTTVSETSVTAGPAPLELLEESKRAQKSGGIQGISALPHYESWIANRAGKNAGVRGIKALCQQIRKKVLRISDIPPSKDGRHIDLDASRNESLIDERTGRIYIGNTIRSTRYTAWNFLPRQLVAQFSKLANFYFLCVSILQMIPGLSTTGRYTTILPLLFFVSISMSKEGYDDFRRYKLDKVENNRDTKVLHAYRPIPGTTSTEEEDDPKSKKASGHIHWATIKWKDVQVGEIVKLNRDEAAPADMVLLYSSGFNGVAYFETMALDGETNLKTKQTTHSLAKVCKSPGDVAKCRAHFVVEDPNLDLYNFEGKVTVDGETAPLTNTEVIYRGSVLRNTPEAIGMVIYSGEECKIRMNANKNPRIKAPRLQSMVNKIVLVMVVFVILLSVFNSVAYQFWSSRVEDDAWYLTDASVAFFPIFASFIIMFNTLIPLSLYVSLEIVKLFQMFFLNDIDMYHEESDTPFEARTSTINEELGQVSYIFSDKTGTLTDNSMKFRKMSVAGTAWLHDKDIKEVAQEKKTVERKKSKGKRPMRKAWTSVAIEPNRLGRSERGPISPIEDPPFSPLTDAERRPADVKRWSSWTSSARPSKSQPEMRTEDLLRYLQLKPYTLFARKARLFLLSIALCHTCLPETKDDGEISFQASSPDELALVQAARDLGYLVFDRDAQILTLKVYPNGLNAEPVIEQYEILDVIEFSSQRKRMSVVLRFPDKRICVLCKGADTVIMQRLKLATLANQKVVEIEQRANKRKSLEAQHAIARRSEQVERKSSLHRASMSLARSSIGTLGRPSMPGNQMQRTRDELDSWLTQREQDVDISSVENDTVYYSPRPSMQLGSNRQSAAFSDPRNSVQVEDVDELVDESLVVDEPAVIERTFQHINDFATEGLRTLLYGYRFMDEAEYNRWKKIYHDATTSLVDRTRRVEEAGELIEVELDLGGATAIEDKLQKGVPHAIDKLRRANIKMWMLTGDKRETAINIGHSCRLIKDYSYVTVLDHEAGEVEQHIAAAILAINHGQVAHSVVVIDGRTLGLIEADKNLHPLFFELAVMADAVVCCRASPSQKAGLVKAVRKKVKKSVTLAIGDGANDIAMIQEAHVGIGITGKEGLQAARTSDYSFAQFRFLAKLLLVHGRWNYVRTCKYTVGTFWKEMLFYLTQAMYQRWNGHTGTSLYEEWSLTMFNTLFTSLPVIFLGIAEKELRSSTLLAVPELYHKGQRSEAFNFPVYLGWMFMASSEAAIIYFSMLGIFGQALFTHGVDLYAMGVMTYASCVILISIKLLGIEMHNKSVVPFIGMFLSIGAFFLWHLVISAIYAPDNPIYNVRDGFLDRFGRNPLWWITLVLILTSCVLYEIGVQSLRATFWPDDTHIFQQLEHDPVMRARFERAAAPELQQGCASADWQRKEERRAKRAAKKANKKAAKMATAVSLTEEERCEGLKDAGMLSYKEEREREEQRREGEVLELIQSRLEQEREVEREDGSAQKRESGLDVSEMLSRRFGSVRRESDGG
ncbi:hypothetical protein BDY21DRAFT_293484 [Lineolata rhizophorae]|uniref:Phospholipid-transporting ATPase n=1 Tax=Lineolata rhizophorae TaxID=578093 RepID=A0A6A6NN84_9PEZI|nr:hypothetical protein BDY21DRAFT_293484 [Lineolata rhizophorae]